MAKFTFMYGTMKSGKSMELIKTYTNYLVKDQKPLVLKSAIDTRDSNTVATRLGSAITCQLLGQNQNIADFLQQDGRNNPPVILIDEAQFLTKSQVIECGVLVDTQNIDVICFGLKTDFTNHLFEGSKALIEEADKLVEIKTLCAFCNKKATHNLLTELREDGYRYAVDSENVDGNIVIGDEDFFQCCRKHYYFYGAQTRKVQ